MKTRLSTYVMNTEPCSIVTISLLFLMLLHFGVSGKILALMMILYTI